MKSQEESSSDLSRDVEAYIEDGNDHSFNVNVNKPSMVSKDANKSTKPVAATSAVNNSNKKSKLPVRGDKRTMASSI